MVTVGIADESRSQKLAEGEEGDTSGEEPTGPTDPIPGCTIFTLTLDQATGAFKFELKGPLDHGDLSSAMTTAFPSWSRISPRTPSRCSSA